MTRDLLCVFVGVDQAIMQKVMGSTICNLRAPGTD